MTDEALARRLAKGSRAALDQAVTRFTPYVSAVAWRVLAASPATREDLEEVVADVFLALWNNAGKILPNAARSWLATVARNTACSRLRRASDTLPLDEEAVIVDDRTPEAALERREQAVRVRMALLSLTGGAWIVGKKRRS